MSIVFIEKWEKVIDTECSQDKISFWKHLMQSHKSLWLQAHAFGILLLFVREGTDCVHLEISNLEGIKELDHLTWIQLHL